MVADIEARASKELHQQREHEHKQHDRRLHAKKKHHHRHNHRRRHYQKHFPRVQSGTQHGMMIDAGSQGTRIHIYEYKARILEKKDLKLVVTGQMLSYPTTNTRWTNRLQPGLDSFAFIEDPNQRILAIADYLKPLLDFAKMVLYEKRSHWGSYPIFLKATGGVRALPRPMRLTLIQDVRNLFHNRTFNPFSFATERARVISGEEEAIYGWAAINFVQRTLLNVSKGLGTVDPNVTYGMLEMGGASTQIGFFEPNEDVMANLFKLQIGASKHWNVYAHSFLYFGVNGAYDRLNAALAAFSDRKRVYNPCLPGQSNYTFTSRVRMFQNETLLPLSSPDKILNAPLYTVQMWNPQERGDFDSCYNWTRMLLRKSANSWCDFAHDLDCSFAGIYQPPLPVENFEFIATSNFYHIWDFLKLPERDTLANFKAASRKLCEMNLSDLKAYNAVVEDHPDDLTVMCFRSVFMSALLIDGIGFPESYRLQVAYIMNGQKVGWPLGSILYEINTLPWEFEKSLLSRVALLGMARQHDANSSGYHHVVALVLTTILLATAFTHWIHRRRRTTVRLRNPEATPLLSGRQRWKD